MSEWIEVSEREPAVDAQVIAYIPQHLKSYAGWFERRTSGRTCEKFLVLDDDTFRWELVTHWMPWPEAPK